MNERLARAPSDTSQSATIRVCAYVAGLFDITYYHLPLLHLHLFYCIQNVSTMLGRILKSKRNDHKRKAIDNGGKCVGNQLINHYTKSFFIRFLAGGIVQIVCLLQKQEKLS